MSGATKLDAPTWRRLLRALAFLLAAALAMTFYVIHLRHLTERQEAEIAAASTGLEPPPAPLASGPRPALLVVPDATGKLGIQRISLQLPSATGQQLQAELQALFTALAQPAGGQRLPETARIKSVFLFSQAAVLQPAGAGHPAAGARAADTAVVDVNAAVADQRASATDEALLVESMGRTIAANQPSVKRFKLLIEGRERGSLAGGFDISGYFPTAAPR